MSDVLQRTCWQRGWQRGLASRVFMTKLASAAGKVERNDLLTLLGLVLRFHVSHWQASTATNDHLALGELYESLRSHTDLLAELIFGKTGDRYFQGANAIPVDPKQTPSELLQLTNDTIAKIRKQLKAGPDDDLLNVLADMDQAVNLARYKLSAPPEEKKAGTLLSETLGRAAGMGRYLGQHVPITPAEILSGTGNAAADSMINLAKDPTVLRGHLNLGQRIFQDTAQNMAASPWGGLKAMLSPGYGQVKTLRSLVDQYPALKASLPATDHAAFDAAFEKLLHQRFAEMGHIAEPKIKFMRTKVPAAIGLGGGAYGGLQLGKRFGMRDQAMYDQGQLQNMSLYDRMQHLFMPQNSKLGQPPQPAPQPPTETY